MTIQAIRAEERDALILATDYLTNIVVCLCLTLFSKKKKMKIYFLRMVQLGEKINNNILGPKFVNQKLIQPKLS